MPLEQLAQGKILQRREGVLVAKELRHADQHVGQQQGRFLCPVLQQLPIRPQGRHARHLHAAFDAPQDRRGLVVAKVMRRAGAQHGEDVA
ncbi:hypothetical protein D3C71_1035890 [compost metagenome]